MHRKKLILTQNDLTFLSFITNMSPITSAMDISHSYFTGAHSKNKTNPNRKISRKGEDGSCLKEPPFLYFLVFRSQDPGERRRDLCLHCKLRLRGAPGMNTMIVCLFPWVHQKVLWTSLAGQKELEMTTSGTPV